MSSIRNGGSIDVPETPILEIRGLQVQFATYAGIVSALNGVDLTIRRGEVLGLVGETGCGKSVTAYATINLVRPPGRIVAGEIRFRGQDLLRLPGPELEAIRGRDIAMIFQSPRSSLNPLFTSGDQLTLYVRTHQRISAGDAARQSLRMLEQVGIADPSRVMQAFPHELSTGMCQRVMIAMALSCSPQLLIADEPTTGIDVTLQAQILRLITDLVHQARTATLLITHDLGVVAETCDRVAVMYAGRIVEEGSVEEVFTDPRHPYTQGLVASTLRVDQLRPLHVIPGAVPSLLQPPRACMFRFRCALAEPLCGEADPPFMRISVGQRARCHFANQTSGFAGVEAQRRRVEGQEIAVLGNQPSPQTSRSDGGR